MTTSQTIPAVTLELAHFAANLHFQQLPKAVVEHEMYDKLYLSDYLESQSATNVTIQSLGV